MKDSKFNPKTWLRYNVPLKAELCGGDLIVKILSRVIMDYMFEFQDVSSRSMDLDNSATS